MRTLLLLFALLALPLAAQAQVKDSLVIRFKSGDSVKIAFDDISHITFATTAAVSAARTDDQPVALAYPNPAASGSTIAFTLARPQQISLEILDVDGKRLRTITALCETGPQEIRWDGLLENGELAISGTYLYRVLADDKILSGKLTVRK